MPIIRIEMLAGRDAATKAKIAEEITQIMVNTAGASAAATAVLFTDVAPSDWAVAGKPLKGHKPG